MGEGKYRAKHKLPWEGFVLSVAGRYHCHHHSRETSARHIPRYVPDSLTFVPGCAVLKYQVLLGCCGARL